MRPATNKRTIRRTAKLMPLSSSPPTWRAVRARFRTGCNVTDDRRFGEGGRCGLHRAAWPPRDGHGMALDRAAPYRTYATPSAVLRLAVEWADARLRPGGPTDSPVF